MGQISAICEGCIILYELFLGTIFDLFGRKYPLIAGLFIASIGLGVIPLFRELYPSFLILKIMIAVGSVAGIAVPLLPDYVSKPSMNMASGY